MDRFKTGITNVHFEFSFYCQQVENNFSSLKDTKGNSVNVLMKLLSLDKYGQM